MVLVYKFLYKKFIPILQFNFKRYDFFKKYIALSNYDINIW